MLDEAALDLRQLPFEVPEPTKRWLLAAVQHTNSAAPSSPARGSVLLLLAGGRRLRVRGRPVPGLVY